MRFPSAAAFLFANSGLRPSGDAGIPISVDPHRMNSLSRATLSPSKAKQSTVLAMGGESIASAFSNMNSKMVENDEKALKELQELSASFKKLAASDTSKLFGNMKVAKGSAAFEPDQKRMFSSMEYNILTESNKLIGYSKPRSSVAGSPIHSVSYEADQSKRFANIEHNIRFESNQMLGPDKNGIDKSRLVGPDAEKADQQKRFSNMEHNIKTESNQLVKGTRRNVSDKTRLVGPDPRDTAEIRDTIKHGFRKPSSGGGMDPPGAPSFNPFQK